MTASPAAVVAALGLLLGYATLAAALDAGLAAGAAGAPPGRSALAPLAETARLLRQRRRVTLAADRVLWRVGSVGLVVAPLLMVAVVPVGGWVLVDSQIGVVWFNTADIVVWAVVWLTGWGANAIHGLIGGYRFLAQALAYELPLMFALTAPAVAAASLHLPTIVAAQQTLWNVVWMPVAFVVVALGVVGFSLWGPLSPAAADDVAGGVLAELSGPDRLLARAGRYLLLTAGAAFLTAAFLGGGDGPGLPEPLWMLVKTALLLAVLVGLRRLLPLLRPERFMELGWLVLLPASLLQVLLVALVVVGRS